MRKKERRSMKGRGVRGAEEMKREEKGGKVKKRWKGEVAPMAICKSRRL